MLSLGKVNGQSSTYSREAVSEDLTFLKKELIRHHPNLFVYTSPENFESFWDSLIGKLPPELTGNEAFFQIALAVGSIKDGHTLLFPPVFSWKSMGKLPFLFYQKGTHLSIRKDLSPLNRDLAGWEVKSINGRSSQALLKEMMGGMMQDGENPNYPRWILNQYFAEYYAIFYGSQDSFSLTLTQGGSNQSIQVKARYPSPDPSAQNVSSSPKAIYWKIQPETSIAYLTILDAHNDRLKKQFGQRFKQEVKAAFAEISSANSEYLILDLRDNQGGNLGNGKTLLSYLLTKPFQIVEGYQKVNPSSGAQGGERLVACGGPHTGTYRPAKNVFSGKVYVLINGGCFSNTAIVCTALRNYNRAIFIGTETGGSSTVLAGNIKNKVLLHTGIRIELPTLQYQLPKNAQYPDGGVKPDYPAEATLEELISGRDIALETALALIQKDQQKTE